jgi:alpha-aminoadipic semialdehyde synthase
VFGVTGTGRVSSGALEILELLPHDYVSPPDLENYLKNAENSPNNTKKIVICQFEGKHLFELREDPNENGTEFDKTHFYANPHLYRSRFAEKYMNNITFLVHGIYFEPKYPRIMTISDL